MVRGVVRGARFMEPRYKEVSEAIMELPPQRNISNKTSKTGASVNDGNRN